VLVQPGGCGSCFLHASFPALRSSIILGLVLVSHRWSQSCKIAVSHRSCLSGCGHWRIWLVSSLGCPQQGQSAICCSFIFTIRQSVVQNPVVNFVVHLHIVIVWPEMTFSMVSQSTRLMLIRQNLAFPVQ